MMVQKGDSPITGVGIGLRNPHIEDILSGEATLNWFEILVDNYLGRSPHSLNKLAQIRQDYPMSFHGVGMSLAGSEALDRDYLRRLAQCIRDFEPQWISDHLCWTHHGQHYLHDLLPVPCTEAIARQVAQRISQVQDILGQRILVENVSSYLQWQASEMREWEFLNLVAEEADCHLLLDVNNIYVSAWNQDFHARDYVDGICKARVHEIHLAGYAEQEDMLLDTHSEQVHPPVWALFAHALKSLSRVPVLIEWDNDLPALDILLEEARKAERILATEGADAA